MLKHFRTAAAIALLTFATSAIAQQDSTKSTSYTVKKGDTLWSIAAQLLDKPWRWPQLWQANPDIANPNLIYPGDIITLTPQGNLVVQPAKPGAKVTTTKTSSEELIDVQVNLDTPAIATIEVGPRQEAPVTSVPLSEIEPFLRNLRVVDDFSDLPRITGMPDGRTRAIVGIDVYVSDLKNPQIGQRYAIMRPNKLYDGPAPSRDLDSRGKVMHGESRIWSEYQTSGAKGGFLGYELEQVNIGTITAVDTARKVATLRLSNDGHEVRINDRLASIEAQTYDLQFAPHPPTSALKYGKVRVISIADTLFYGGTRDVVAISAGAREGLDNGTVLSVLRPGGNKFPDQHVAHVMVFKTYDRVSYGLIMTGTAPVRIGDYLLSPDTP